MSAIEACANHIEVQYVAGDVDRIALSMNRSFTCTGNDLATNLSAMFFSLPCTIEASCDWVLSIVNQDGANLCPRTSASLCRRKSQADKILFSAWTNLFGHDTSIFRSASISVSSIRPA